jgi:NAD(P)-dependent dehydrogenase (short-subunit alcohol dehydrogenase family)
MLLECLRLDLHPHGVAVTTVHLGFVDTPMVAHRRGAMPQRLTPEHAAAHILRALSGRPARIDFPQPLAGLARAAAALPDGLRDPLVRWLARD